MEYERISVCKMEVLENDIFEDPQVPSTTLTAVGNNCHTLTTSENKAICDECFKEFASANTLWAHKKRYHCGDPLLKCNICHKTFHVLFRLTYHLKDKHGLSGDRLESCLAEHSSKWNITCFDQECQQRFRRMSNYHEHLTEVHGIIMETEVRDFASIEEFNQWFEMMERYNNSHYVQHRGERPDRNSIKSKLLFCHRSGFARIRAVKGLRKGRKRDTCKMSGYCSSFMEVNQYPDDGVKVKYWKTHVGHGTSNEVDIIHLPIPQHEKEHIAGLLLRGVSKQDIVKSYSEESGPGSRMSYLRGHDIGNIKISFHLDTEEGIRMHEQHKEAMDLVAKVVQQGPFVFTVPSSLQMDKQYIVQKGSECLDKKCPSRCLLCQACLHSLACDCKTAENEACKHAHAVNMWCKFQRQHRLFYEHEQEVTDIPTSSKMEKTIPPTDEFYSTTTISKNTGTRKKSSEIQVDVDKMNTELESLLENAKMLLVELMAMIDECKDINAVAKFIELLNKTKTALTIKLNNSGRGNKPKERLVNSTFGIHTGSKPYNSMVNKVNDIQPIKIITNKNTVSLSAIEQNQLNNTSTVSNISLNSSENQNKFINKIQSQPDRVQSCKVTKQKTKHVMVMLDSKDNKILLQDINCVKEDIIKPKVNLNSKNHKRHLINNFMEKTATLSQTNFKSESQQLVPIPSSTQFIEENNQLLSSYINGEHLLTDTDSENIKLPMKYNENSIELPGTSKENVRIVNMIKTSSIENTECFLDNSCVQEDLNEPLRKIRTFVKEKDGQLKEFFFKIRD